MKIKWLTTIALGMALLCAISSTVVVASTFNTNTAINVEHVCLISPKRCLNVVKSALQSTSEHSRRWFDLLQFRYDALFNLKRFAQLKRETKPWIDREDVPLPFQVTALIYFAKSSYNDDEIESSIHYALLAEKKLALLQTTYPSPMRLIELANLQMHTNQLTKAYASLQALEQEYQHSQNAHFMMELYGNLGHLSDKLGDKNTSLDYWLITKEWSFKFGNKQQIATVSHNLARIYGELGYHELAVTNLKIAGNMAQIAGDLALVAQVKLLLTAFYIDLKQYCRAYGQWQSISIENLPDYYEEQRQVVLQRLQDARCPNSQMNK